MKSLPFLLLMGVLALMPVRMNAMMDSIRSEEEKEGEAEDPNKRTIQNTEEERKEALIEASRRIGVPNFSPTVVIETFINVSGKEASSGKEETSLSNETASSVNEESEELFDLDVLQQRIQEAREAIIYLSDKGAVLPKRKISKKKIEEFDQEWWLRYACYEQALVDFSKRENKNKLEVVDEQLVEAKLEELMEVSLEVIKKLQQRFEDRAGNEVARVGASTRSQEKLASAQEMPQPRELEGGYLYPELGGCIYQGRRYTQHALERMAPNTPAIVELLLSRAFDKMKSRALEIKKTGTKNKTIEDDSVAGWWKTYCPKPRSILPALVEATIRSPKNSYLTVKTSEEGDVITVFRKGDVESDLSFSAADIKKIKHRARLLKYQPSLFETSQGVKSHETGEHEKTQQMNWENNIKDWEKNIKEAQHARKTKNVDIAAWKEQRAAKLTQVAQGKEPSKIVVKAKNTILAPTEVVPTIKKEISLEMKTEEADLKKEEPLVDSWEELVED